MLVANFPSEDHIAVPRPRRLQCWPALLGQRKGVLSRGARTTSTPPQELFGITRSRSALSGPGRDNRRIAHLEHIGREEYGRGMTNICKTRPRVRHAPAGVLAALLAVKAYRTGGTVSARVLTWRRLITAGVIVAVAAAAGGAQSRGEGILGSWWTGRVENAGLRAEALHDTKQLARSAPAPSTRPTGRRCLGRVASCMPALTPFVAIFFL